jgi:hypothetical protein
MLFLNDDLYSFEYDAELDCWILTWNEYVFSNEYREINERMLEQLENRTMRKLIRDTRKLNIVSVRDQQWFIEYVVPKLLATDLQYAAIIVPENTLAKMAVEDIALRLTPGRVDTRFFADLEAAKAWMKTV